MTNFNKKEIMTRAWELHKRSVEHYGGLNCYSIVDGVKSLITPITFGEALKQAWAEVKPYVERARLQARAYANPVIGAELTDIDNTIFILQMKDRWNDDDYKAQRNLEAKKQKLIELAA